MIGKDKIKEVVVRIAENINPDKIILFGSSVSGLSKEDSDLDLIIIKKSNLPRQKRGIEVRRLFYGLLIPLDLKIYTPEEFENELKNEYSFLNMALKNSRILYEREA